jgi:hypothetical protein
MMAEFSFTFYLRYIFRWYIFFKWSTTTEAEGEPILLKRTETKMSATRHEINLANFAYNNNLGTAEAQVLPACVGKFAESGNMTESGLLRNARSNPALAKYLVEICFRVVAEAAKRKIQDGDRVLVLATGQIETVRLRANDCQIFTEEKTFGWYHPTKLKKV